MMWSSAAELWENAGRNAKEFGSEGWRWRDAVEDDGMVVWRGEKVHPVHFLTEG